MTGLLKQHAASCEASTPSIKDIPSTGQQILGHIQENQADTTESANILKATMTPLNQQIGHLTKKSQEAIAEGYIGHLAIVAQITEHIWGRKLPGKNRVQR